MFSQAKLLGCFNQLKLTVLIHTITLKAKFNFNIWLVVAVLSLKELPHE